MSYKWGQWSLAVRDLIDAFNLPYDKSWAWKFFDMEMMGMNFLAKTGDNTIYINIFRFDEYLIEKHGQYEGSMRDFVLREYGEKSLQVLLNLMGGE